MSTRAQVIITDGDTELWFYRHSDGYPEGVRPTLNKFMEWLTDGKIRSNVEQAAGWLTVLGHQEYVKEMPDNYHDEPTGAMFDWKVGAYEPCAPVEHGDIEYLYTIDLTAKSVTYQAVHYRDGNNVKSDPMALGVDEEGGDEE